MESIRAKIQGDGINSSVEFTVEEVMARHHGKPWDELGEAGQEAVMKDYARALFTRQSGLNGDIAVNLEPGTMKNKRD